MRWGDPEISSSKLDGEMMQNALTSQAPVTVASYDKAAYTAELVASFWAGPANRQKCVTDQQTDRATQWGIKSQRDNGVVSLTAWIEAGG